MSGLRYRIKRLEGLLSCQIRNPKSAFQLYASFEPVKGESDYHSLIILGKWKSRSITYTMILL
ncbi:hypothetical protein LJR015_000872 [Peribacillus frigoritolerans]|uniref:hypothetical protein n=1 Tax=Peribacillus frigoritolerans TaxID=450367 RepID=UPI003ECD5FAD